MYTVIHCNYTPLVYIIIYLVLNIVTVATDMCWEGSLYSHTFIHVIYKYIT